MQTVDLDVNVKRLLGLQEQLYGAGARNFIFLGIPPLHRSPAGRNSFVGLTFYISFFYIGEYGFRRERVDYWNELLGSSIAKFAEMYQDSTALFFSPAEIFSKLLDDPAFYGFDVPGGVSMWMDHIHPTSRVHDFLAADLTEFLKSVQPALKS